MKVLFLYETRLGPATIRYNPTTSRYLVFLTDEPLDNYHSAEHCAEAIANGRTQAHSLCHDTSVLGIPEELVEWTRIS